MATNKTADRIAARAARRGSRRVGHFAPRITAAPTQDQALAEACDYLRAVGRRLDEDGKRELVREVVRLADERNER